MPNARIADLFHVRSRFLRSAHLERDFHDSSALSGYVVTPQVEQYLNRLASGLAPDSGQRAWRITGDYGVGKSSFALVLAHVLAGRSRGIVSDIRERVDFSKLEGRRPKLLPVLVTGSRNPVAVAILRSLNDALQKVYTRGRPPKVLGQIERLLRAAETKAPPDAAVIEAIQEASRFVIAGEHGSGLLIVLDELGKFLEYASLHPDRQDVYFLQSLAEAASRSGEIPFVVVGLLHQGFNAYADRLSESAQREWQKVAGRFEELIFDRPLEQTASLIADALNMPLDEIPKGIQRRAKDAMGAALALGWYGTGRSDDELRALAPRLYPLHPTVLPVLTRLFSRFGQNERSLFGFLLSNETFGLPSFAEQDASASRFYRIHNLYDYARASFGHRLSVQSYRNHWNLIESVVESFPAEDVVQSQVLKTVAMLNLLDDQGLLASHDAIELAVSADESDTRRVREAISKLSKKRVVYLRGVSRGFCLWPHTSVNVEKAFDEAKKAIGPLSRVSSLVEEELDTRPVVARRHYIETGNLRHFEVRPLAPTELSTALNQIDFEAADGVILLPLCETAEDRSTALEFARSPALEAYPAVLVAVPKPLEMLQSMAQLVRRWEWVAQSTPELIHDRYAAEEVSRELTNARRTLRNRIQDLVGLRSYAEHSELEWFRCGRVMRINTSRELLSVLSNVCDEVYPEAPRVRNELVNRRELSSAAASARMRLIERLLSSPDEPLLGLDAEKKPPEMSMYLSVLQRGNLHIKRGNRFTLQVPNEQADPLKLRPTFARIRELLGEKPDARVPVTRLFAELRKQPFGVRDGLIPLLLAVFSVIHEDEVAFYSNDAFVRKMSGHDFMRLIKAPEAFELQLCRVTGLRAALFAELANILSEPEGGTGSESMLDVVRTLCVFAAQLPTFSHKTRRIGKTALAVRDVLIGAREPGMLLFRDLPQACGFEPFQADARTKKGLVSAFVTTLKGALDELRSVYPELLQQLRMEIVTAFERPGTFGEARKQLAQASLRLLPTLSEPRLRGLCLRLADTNLPESEWLESMGSFICAKPPAKWLDLDTDQFREELQRLSRQFRRVEATVFAPGAGTAVRVAVTLPDGSDVEQVVHLAPEDEAQAAMLESEIQRVLSRSRRIGMAAAARVLWKEMRPS